MAAITYQSVRATHKKHL